MDIEAICRSVKRVKNYVFFFWWEKFEIQGMFVKNISNNEEGNHHNIPGNFPYSPFITSCFVYFPKIIFIHQIPHNQSQFPFPLPCMFERTLRYRRPSLSWCLFSYPYTFCVISLIASGCNPFLCSTLESFDNYVMIFISRSNYEKFRDIVSQFFHKILFFSHRNEK